MFVWNKKAVTQSCCFDDDVREALVYFQRKKVKQKKCLNLGKMSLDCTNWVSKKADLLTFLN